MCQTNLWVAEPKVQASIISQKAEASKENPVLLTQSRKTRTLRGSLIYMNNTAITQLMENVTYFTVQQVSWHLFNLLLVCPLLCLLQSLHQQQHMAKHGCPLFYVEHLRGLLLNSLPNSLTHSSADKSWAEHDDKTKMFSQFLRQRSVYLSFTGLWAASLQTNQHLPSLQKPLTL